MRALKRKIPKNPEIRKDFRPLLLSVHDATAMLSVSKSMVYRLIAEKALARVRIGRRTLVPFSSVRSFIERNEIRQPEIRATTSSRRSSRRSRGRA
jgi:excisionase family DNA binding protein